MSDSSRCSARLRLLPKLDVSDSLGLWRLAKDMIMCYSSFDDDDGLDVIALISRGQILKCNDLCSFDRIFVL